MARAPISRAFSSNGHVLTARTVSGFNGLCSNTNATPSPSAHGGIPSTTANAHRGRCGEHARRERNVVTCIRAGNPYAVEGNEFSLAGKAFPAQCQAPGGTSRQVGRAPGRCLCYEAGTELPMPAPKSRTAGALAPRTSPAGNTRLRNILDLVIRRNIPDLRPGDRDVDRVQRVVLVGELVEFASFHEETRFVGAVRNRTLLGAQKRSSVARSVGAADTVASMKYRGRALTST